MRGWVCRLQFLLALASAVIFGSASRGIRDNILLSQILDFPFRRLLLLAGLRWRYSNPPPHGRLIHWSSCPGYKFSAPTTYKTPFFCLLRIRCRGNVFTELLPRNGLQSSRILRIRCPSNGSRFVTIAQ
jgi:hypothetical protein